MLAQRHAPLSRRQQRASTRASSKKSAAVTTSQRQIKDYAAFFLQETVCERAYAKILSEINAKQEAERQRQAKETEEREQQRHQEALSKRDPGDVVSQVLNYTVSGRDEGTDTTFWWHEPDQPCIYHLWETMSLFKYTRTFTEWGVYET